MDLDGGSDKTILLVEDDSMVRVMVTEMMQGSGFTILVAAGPLMAIEMLADSNRRIDLLVSDVVMPDMSGTELYERLVESYPDLKAVYISGYPVNPGTKRKKSDGEFQYLQKPFTGEELLQRIRQVMC
jgi:CheY-like chemotaxis protein